MASLMEIRHVRSISLPARPHPLSSSVEVQLERLRSSQESSSSKCHKLSGLKALFQRVDDLLQLPTSHQALSNAKDCKPVEQVLEGSLRLLDVCGTTMDIFSQMMESMKELESSLRRKRGGECSSASEIKAYFIVRKKLNQMAYKSRRELKKMEKNLASAPMENFVITRLMEAEEISVQLFDSILSSISQTAGKSRSGGWSIVPRLGFSYKREAEAETNPMDKMDTELLVLKATKNLNSVQLNNVLEGVKAMESSIQELEEELECVYRQLLKMRVALLNIRNY